MSSKTSKNITCPIGLFALLKMTFSFFLKLSKNFDNLIISSIAELIVLQIKCFILILCIREIN